MVNFISVGPVDLHPRILNSLPASTATLLLPASTAGKGYSEDTWGGLVSKIPRLPSTQFGGELKGGGGGGGGCMPTLD